MDPKAFTDVMYVALTLFGEARGESYESKKLIAWVIRNRYESGKYGRMYPDVVTARTKLKNGKAVYQFTGWDPSDPNRMKLSDPMGGPTLSDEAWYACVRAAMEVLSAPAEANPIPGTYNYIDDSIPPPPWTRSLEAFRMPGAPRFIFYRRRA